MLDIEEIKSEVLKRLKPLNPNKIILFGSYAYGTPHKDSDIDLIAHTKKMYEKFVDFDSIFSREILTKGQTIYG